MTTSQDIDSLGQATEKNHHFRDLSGSNEFVDGRSEGLMPAPEITFTAISSHHFIGSTGSTMSALAPEACLATTHPGVLFWGGLIAAAGFGLLAYGFMS